jgi:CDP-glucose 4,6-dehydratase
MEGLVMNQEFWRNKKVFLTGHTGFKGSWLSLWLQKLGAHVTGYALESPTYPALYNVADVQKGMTSVIGDVRDSTKLMQTMRDISPEIVFHMAAQPLVRRSYLDPVETYSTNVMGTVHLLEAARQTASIRAIVNVTTDKCYENKEWVWGYREDEPMGGYDPYSNSKGCSELVSAAYRASFFNSSTYDQHGVALATARAGNVIGGGDWAADRLVPDILAAMQAGQSVRIRNPHAIRPWQHVLEPLSGYLQLAQALYERGPEVSQAFNFGPSENDAKPVHWIVERLTQQWGSDAGWQVDEGEHPHEAHYLRLDCSKARAILGWQPQWHLEIALEKIVGWHKEYLNNKNLREFCLHQIDEYMQ